MPKTIDYYVRMNITEWDNVTMEPDILPFGGAKSGSVGFMEVFDDLERLQSEYPNSEFFKIRKSMEDDHDRNIHR